MKAEVTLYFRDQLRQARAIALRDSEAFEESIFVFERLGSYLMHKRSSLGTYKQYIVNQARNSVLAEEIPNEWRDFHTPFSILYDSVREARNDAMHQGDFARHLTIHAIELSIILEDSLMKECVRIGEYMVRNPVCAFSWQPLSFVRQTMLVNSFSYLPVIKDSEAIGLISDLELAQHLRRESDGQLCKKRLAQLLGDVLDSNAIECCKTKICTPDILIKDALKEWDGRPIIVQSNSKQLLGILTPFDLL